MSNSEIIKTKNPLLSPTVLVTGAGYFVDVYDILIFNIVRVPSLTAMGLSGSALTDMGLYILNLQLAGLLVGGFVWGALADKFGRKSCLFASILLYSVATLACAFTTDADVYAWLRLICGFGLAGEVGVGVCMIVEQLPPDKRGMGVGLFSFIGIMGAVVAGIVTEMFDWRVAYYIGGGAGLLLLLARAMLMESGMYQKLEEKCAGKKVTLGSLLPIFRNRLLRRRYLCAILIGVPIYFTIALIWTLAPELAPALGVTEPVKASTMIGVGYFVMTFGGLIAVWVGEKLQSRKRTVLLCQLGELVMVATLLLLHPEKAITYYVMGSAIGFFMGYWMTMITLGAEQFGTNIRGVAATTIPNFVRASAIPINLAFAALKPQGMLFALVVITIVVFVIAIAATRGLEETYGKDLDYVA